MAQDGRCTIVVVWVANFFPAFCSLDAQCWRCSRRRMQVIHDFYMYLFHTQLIMKETIAKSLAAFLQDMQAFKMNAAAS